MGGKTINSLMFIIGVSVGSAAAWYYTKRKYEHILQEEIDSVKAVFSKRKLNHTEEVDVSEFKAKATQATEKPNVVEYASKLQKNRYINYSSINARDEKKEKEEPMNKPYVIEPEKFGEIDDYEKISLTYYSDHILADDANDLVSNIDEIVGIESLSCFGEYEEDSVFVRNDRMKCDYEILLDLRKYSDTKRHNKSGAR